MSVDPASSYRRAAINYSIDHVEHITAANVSNPSLTPSGKGVLLD
jgi:hypothetical protein